jgi:Cu(I)/Ag(I) efflux system membrane fusion protein
VTLNDHRTFSARVSDVLPQVDPETRVLKLRLEANNPNFALRPDMFVDVELPVEGAPGVTVPQGAVVDSGQAQRVFVERSAGIFEPRNVKIGWRSGDRVEIVHGLAEGERVVVEGTFMVDSESRLKSQAATLDDEKAHSSKPSKSSML